MKDLKVPVEIELFIWRKLCSYVYETGKAGLSLSYYHSLEVEVFLSMGYFVNFETGYKTTIDHSEYQLNVCSKKIKPREGQLVVFVGKNRRARFFKR